MDATEIETFATELILAFPAFKSFAEKHSPNFERTKQAWGVAWKDLKLAECREALRRLLIEGGITYEQFQQPGSFIRRLVVGGRSDSERVSQEREATRYERQQRRKAYVGSPMAEALRQAQLCKTKEDAYRVIESGLPKRSEYDQPRYRCSTCCDRGLVVVWRADFVAMVRAGRKSLSELTRAHTYVVSCYCDVGTEINEPKKNKLPVYSTGSVCKFDDDEIENEHKKLSEWIDEQSKGVAWVP